MVAGAASVRSLRSSLVVVTGAFIALSDSVRTADGFLPLLWQSAELDAFLSKNPVLGGSVSAIFDDGTILEQDPNNVASLNELLKQGASLVVDALDPILNDPSNGNASGLQNIDADILDYYGEKAIIDGIEVVIEDLKHTIENMISTPFLSVLKDSLETHFLNKTSSDVKDKVVDGMKQGVDSASELLGLEEEDGEKLKDAADKFGSMMESLFKGESEKNKKSSDTDEKANGGNEKNDGEAEVANEYEAETVTEAPIY
jgi:hypothetical protein